MVTKAQALAVLLILLTCITLANAALGAYNYYNFKGQVKQEHKGLVAVSTQNCEEIELVKGAVRATIEQAQKFVRTSHIRSQTEKAASEQYYTEVLDKFKRRDCKPTRKEKHGSRILRKAPR